MNTIGTLKAKRRVGVGNVGCDIRDGMTHPTCTDWVLTYEIRLPDLPTLRGKEKFAKFEDAQRAANDVWIDYMRRGATVITEIKPCECVSA